MYEYIYTVHTPKIEMKLHFICAYVVFQWNNYIAILLWVTRSMWNSIFNFLQNGYFAFSNIVFFPAHFCLLIWLSNCLLFSYILLLNV